MAEHAGQLATDRLLRRDILRPQQQDRGCRTAQHAFGYAAENKPADARPAVGGHRHQADRFVADILDDALRRLAKLNFDTDAVALLAQAFGIRPQFVGNFAAQSFHFLFDEGVAALHGSIVCLIRT